MPAKSKGKTRAISKPDSQQEEIDINVPPDSSDSELQLEETNAPANRRAPTRCRTNLDTGISAEPSPLPSLISELSDVAVSSRKAYNIQQLFRVDEQARYRYCKTCE